MDVARPPRKKTVRNVLIGGGVLAVAGIFTWLATLKQAAPTVDMAVVIQDSVRQGDMIREVRGPGTLVPEQIQFITAPATARVDRVVVQSGETVTAGDVLLEMSSPETVIATLTADQNLNAARAVAGDPAILLADEPTGNLDSVNGEAVMDLLRELHRNGATICMVTHDPRYEAHADRSIHLFDGRVIDEQTAAALHVP